MSSVLHPVGPEEPRTYWLRRVGVVAALLVLIAVVAWAVWPKSATTAGPSGTASPAPTTGSSAVPTPSASPGGSTSPTGSPSARPSASPSAGSALTPASTPKTTPTPSSTPTPTAVPVTACDAKDVRVTLTGPGRVQADKKTTFKLSVINGSAVTCIVDLSTTTFELKIYSGSDRIWTSDDCAKWLAAEPSHRLGVEKAYEWTIDWSGQRSKIGCTLTGGLKAGTYVATAQLTVGSAKSEPVQVVMRLR